MTIEFKMPTAGPDTETVDVVQVLVSEGDTVEAGDPVIEVQIEKAVAEIECTHSGSVEKVHVAEGDTIKVGAVLLSLSGDGGNGQAAASKPAASAPKPAATPAPADPAPATKAEPSAAPAGGSKDFLLPSPGDEPAEVVEVLVKEGDMIEEDDLVCLVQTEKAVAELESPYTGRITKVNVKESDLVEEGHVLITVELTAPSKSAPAPAAKPSAPAPPAAKSAPTKAAPTAAPAVRSAPSAPDNRPPAPAGPATRRLARKLGVDLHAINGTGPGGRITQEDLEAHVKRRLESGGGGGAAAPPLPDFTKWGEVERQPMNAIAKASAKNLSIAWTNIPHVTQQDNADITELEAARKRYVKANPNRPKITMTAIMIKAVVSALKAFPNFNASVDPETNEFVLKHFYNIGVAVDTPHGLVVPVIHNCDQKNVLEIAAELTELAGKARDRRLTMDAMTGATFTITNLGGIGGTAFTPIVNYPEVAILGMSRGRKELQLDDDEVVERMMLPLSLSYDHRIVNGADAARFIVKLSSSLSNFFELF
jgi:pyruvate dehydrogenase E2 component (dihydrolipoamide acetyltransferase)